MYSLQRFTKNSRKNLSQITVLGGSICAKSTASKGLNSDSRSHILSGTLVVSQLNSSEPKNMYWTLDGKEESQILSVSYRVASLLGMVYTGILHRIVFEGRKDFVGK